MEEIQENLRNGSGIIVDITCMMCKQDFKDYFEENSRDDYGYCFNCRIKCVYCCEDNIDLKNERAKCLKVCLQCYDGNSIFQADDNDESKSISTNHSYDTFPVLDEEFTHDQVQVQVVKVVRDQVLDQVVSLSIASTQDNSSIVKVILDQVLDQVVVKVILDQILDQVVAQCTSSGTGVISIKDDNTMPIEDDNIISIDDDDDGDNFSFEGGQSLKKMQSVYTEMIQGLGTNAEFGPSNGEMAPAGSKIICDALELNEEDCLLDIGSGGGLALAQMAAFAGNRCSIGVELHLRRHSLSMAFIHHMLEKYPDIELPIYYINNDITEFSTLNGISKLYMFDKVFEPELLIKIGIIINQTTTIKLIASSTADLRNKYFFNVTFIKNLGCLRARGGESHTFYLYKVNHFSLLPTTISYPRLDDAMSVATKREKRYNEANAYMYAFHKSKVSMREVTASNILGENHSKGQLRSSEILYEMFENMELYSSISVNDKSYKLTFKNGYMLRFDEVTLHGGVVKCSAVANLRSKMAGIAPCYDGSNRILLCFHFDSLKASSYRAVVYDISSRSINTSKSFNEVCQLFDHTLSLPFALDEIMKNYEAIYPAELPISTKRSSIAITHDDDNSGPELLSNNKKRQRSLNNKAKRTETQTSQENDTKKAKLDQLETKLAERQAKFKAREDVLNQKAAAQKDLMANLRAQLNEARGNEKAALEKLQNLEKCSEKGTLGRPSKAEMRVLIQDVAVSVAETVTKQISEKITCQGYHKTNDADFEAKVKELSIANTEANAAIAEMISQKENDANENAEKLKELAVAKETIAQIKDQRERDDKFREAQQKRYDDQRERDDKFREAQQKRDDDQREREDKFREAQQKRDDDNLKHEREQAKESRKDLKDHSETLAKYAFEAIAKFAKKD